MGALGRCRLEAGWYLYVGSARRSLARRVERHARKAKPLRWHVDRLTGLAAARVQGALLLPGTRRSECSLNRAVGRLPGVRAPVHGFGASDCSQGCPAHLWHSRRRIAPAELVESLPGGMFVRL